MASSRVVVVVTVAVPAAAVRPEVGVYIASLKTDPLGVEATAKTRDPRSARVRGIHVGHGAGTIHLRAEAHFGRLILSVFDAGPGFPADFLPHALDRFTRSESIRTGLGLALVAASQDGTTRAENTSPGAIVTLDITC